MANPEHVPELDSFDRITVRLYRSGLCIAAGGVALLSGLCAVQAPTGTAQLVILAGVLLSVADMHLYDKRVRWVIGAAGQLGAVGFAAGAVLGLEVLQLAGLGFVFVALSGFALKERFCFKVPGLRAVPLGLALGLIPLVFHWPWIAAVVYAMTSMPLLVLCVAKWRMPLHFDVGMKAAYQV